MALGLGHRFAHHHIKMADLRKRCWNAHHGVARFFLPANTTVLNPILSTAYE